MNVALILAKGGSIGLPNKNLLKFQSKPLLTHTVEELKSSGCFCEIFVSTNCSRIARVANREGARVIMRPNEYARNDRYIDSVNLAIGKMNIRPNTITIPQVVQPLRETNLFERILSFHGPSVDSVVTVAPFGASVDWIYTKNERTHFLEKSKQIVYTKDIARRGDLFLIDNAVVSFTYDSWKRSDGSTPWPYLGKRIVVVEQKRLNVHYHVDINTPGDAEWLEFISLFPEWKKGGVLCD